MPEILNESKNVLYAADSPIAYHDKSLYLQDATHFLNAIDYRKVRELVAEQLRSVIKAAHSKEQTADDLHTEIQKLLQVSDVYRQLVTLKDNSTTIN